MAVRRGADNRQERRRHRIDAGTEKDFAAARRSRSKATRRKQFLDLTAPKRRDWYLNLVESFYSCVEHDDAQTIKGIIREECGVQPYDFVRHGDPVIDCRDVGPHLKARNPSYSVEHRYLFPAPRYDQFGPAHFVDRQGVEFRCENERSEDETSFFFRVPIKARKENKDIGLPYAGAAVQLQAEPRPKKEEQRQDTHVLTVHTVAWQPGRATGALTGTILKL